MNKIVNKLGALSIFRYVMLSLVLGLIGCGVIGPSSHVQTEYQDWVPTARPVDVDDIKKRYPQLRGILVTAREWWEMNRRAEDVAETKSEEGAATQFELEPGTRVEITVFQEPDISGKYIVDPDGAISVPMIGRLFVEGLTFDEVQRKIKQRVSKYVRDPKVSVNIGTRRTRGGRGEITASSITVIGEGSGSQINYTGNETLIKVLSESGWLDDQNAEFRGIKIFVPQKGKTRSKIIIADVHRFLKYGDQTQNIEIGPNYIVYVPQRWNAGRQVQQDLSTINSFLGQVRGFDQILQYFDEQFPVVAN